MRWIVAAALAAACHAVDSSSPATATLTGTVRRGPVAPVCQINVPCDQPFAATFEVRQDGGLVATFRSANDGSFTTKLQPGSYLIVPSADAPLMNPANQSKPVVVRAGDNVMNFTFDTGIR